MQVRRSFCMCHRFGHGLFPRNIITLFIEGIDYDDGGEKQITPFFAEASQGNLLRNHYVTAISVTYG